MTRGVRGSWSSVMWLGRAGGRARSRLHFTMVGLLLMGLAGLLCAPGVSPAASEKANGPDNKADTKGGVDQGALKAEETLIYPNDLLFIQVFDVEQMTREYRVSATGTLLFPLLTEPVRVMGLTPQQSADVISQKCIEAGVLTHPQISVTIRESRVHAVAIAGAVKNPQIYPVFGRITLLDILSQAGGVADDAGSSVTITRGEVSRRVLASKGGGAVEAGKSPPVPPTVSIDLRGLLETGDPTLNIDVYPGDRVTVQRAGVVYVLGAVNKAGGFVLTEDRQDMTVLRALALAEDLKSSAKSKKAMILRSNSSAPGGREEIPVDLRAMLKGRVPDKPLQSKDILFVPDSIAMKALKRAGDVAVTAAGFAAIYR
ncbi:MAG: polysaccharide biosynthesis/export family protein [Terriglobia bacterium]